MKLTRRSFLAASAATAAAGAVMGGSLPALAADTRASVGYNSDYFGASMVAVANSQNLWKKHGIDADVKVFTNGPIQIQAFGANSLDFGYIGPGALWLPAAGKAKVMAINVVGFSDRVVGQPDIKTVADLKGKRVGVPEGTSGDMLLRLALKKADMTVKDIDLISMSPSTIVSAFASKQIDAAGLWYPLIGIMQQHVPDLNMLADDKEFYPKTTFPSAFVVRNELVAKNPDLVKRMIGVIKDAQDFRAANFEESIAETSKLLGVPVPELEVGAKLGKLLTSQELVKLTKDGTVDQWLATLNSMYKSFGRLDNPLDPKQYYLGEMYISA